MATLTLPIRARRDFNTADWQIKKRYLFNPLYNRDTPYNFDYYYQMTRSGGSVKKGCQPSDEDCRMRAVQEVLHRQTNYEDLVRLGIYRLPLAVFEQVMTDWYQQRARENPRWRHWINVELERHLTQWHTSQTRIHYRSNQIPQAA